MSVRKPKPYVFSGGDEETYNDNHHPKLNNAALPQRATTSATFMREEVAPNIAYFANSTTWHGIGKIVADETYPILDRHRNHKYYYRGFWLVLWGLATGYVLYFLFAIAIPKLQGTATNTVYERKVAASLSLPSITLCNGNPYPASIITYDLRAESIPLEKRASYIVHKNMTMTCTPSDELKRFQATSSDDWLNCKNIGDWTDFIDDDFGMCSTFNFKDGAQVSRNGEFVTFEFSEAENDVQIDTEHPYMLVAVHAPEDYFSFGKSVRASKGLATHINIEMNEFKDYKDFSEQGCLDANDSYHAYGPRRESGGQPSSSQPYSVNSCRQRCKAELEIEMCQCATSNSLLSYSDDLRDTYLPCNAAGQICAAALDSDSQCQEVCKPSCESVDYKTTVTQNVYPDAFAREILDLAYLLCVSELETNLEPFVRSVHESGGQASHLYPSVAERGIDYYPCANFEAWADSKFTNSPDSSTLCQQYYPARTVTCQTPNSGHGGVESAGVGEPPNCDSPTTVNVDRWNELFTDQDKDKLGSREEPPCGQDGYKVMYCTVNSTAYLAVNATCGREQVAPWEASTYRRLGLSTDLFSSSLTRRIPDFSFEDAFEVGFPTVAVEVMRVHRQLEGGGPEGGKEDEGSAPAADPIIPVTQFIGLSSIELSPECANTKLADIYAYMNWFEARANYLANRRETYSGLNKVLLIEDHKSVRKLRALVQMFVDFATEVDLYTLQTTTLSKEEREQATLQTILDAACGNPSHVGVAPKRPHTKYLGPAQKRLRNEKTQITIGYGTLETTVIIVEPAYSWFLFLSEVGGFAGLFTGMSVLTFVEVFEFVLFIGMLFFGKTATNRIRAGASVVIQSMKTRKSPKAFGNSASVQPSSEDTNTYGSDDTNTYTNEEQQPFGGLQISRGDNTETF
jgi:hypothetical protein